MKKRNDGGPAFPRPSSNDYGNEGCYEQAGMTLRQFYAGQALSGDLIGRLMDAMVKVDPKIGGLSPSEAIPQVAFEIADAMIAKEAAEDAEPE